jgi:hypothetical protein
MHDGAHAMFTIFLPNAAWEVAGIRRAIEELVEVTGSTGYRLIPPSTGGWYSAEAWSLCPVHPLQIVAPDTEETFDRFVSFTRRLARLLGQSWIYALRMPVRVADHRVQEE